MRKVWVIFAHEYTRLIFRWRFLVVTMGPVVIYGVLMFMGLFLTILMENWAPFGYVDEADLLPALESTPVSRGEITPILSMMSFESETAARKALENEDIQAYFILPADFIQTHRARMVYARTPNTLTESIFRSFVWINLIRSQPDEVAHRALQGAVIDLRMPEEASQADNTNKVTQLVAPLIAVILFYLQITTSSSYMLNAFVREKENRILETLLTSVSPLELITSKTLVGIAVGQTILLFFTLPYVAIILAYPSLLDYIGGGAALVKSLVPNLMIFLLASLMASAILTTIGVTFSQPSENQMVMLLVMLLMAVPVFFFESILTHPSGPLAVGLSAFPLTSPLAVILRQTTGKLPVWQLWLSIALQTVSTVAAYLLAAKAFRAGLMLHGRPLLRVNIWRWRQKTS